MTDPNFPEFNESASFAALVLDLRRHLARMTKQAEATKTEVTRLQEELAKMTKRAEVAEKVAEAAVDVVISNMLDSVEPTQLKYSFKLAVDEYLAERMRRRKYE